MNIETEVEIKNNLWRRMSTGFKQFTPASLAHAFTRAFSRLKICKDGSEYVLHDVECPDTEFENMKASSEKKVTEKSEQSLDSTQCPRQAFSRQIILKQKWSYNLRDMESTDKDMDKQAKAQLGYTRPTQSTNAKRLVCSCLPKACQNSNDTSLSNDDILDKLDALEARVQQQNAVLQKYRSRPMETDKQTLNKSDGFLSNAEMLAQLEKLESRFKKQADVFQKYRAIVPTTMSTQNDIHTTAVIKATGCTNSNAQLLTKQASATEFLTTAEIHNQLEALEARFKQQAEVFSKYRGQAMGNQGHIHTVTMATKQSRRPWFIAQKEASMSVMVVRMMESWRQEDTGS